MILFLVELPAALISLMLNVIILNALAAQGASLLAYWFRLAILTALAFPLIRMLWLKVPKKVVVLLWPFILHGAPWLVSLTLAASAWRMANGNRPSQ